MPEYQVTIPLNDPEAKVIKTDINVQGELVITLEMQSEHDYLNITPDTIRKEIMPALSRVSLNNSSASIARAIVHDLRNPLSTIIGFADMLAKERHEFDDQQIDTITHEILHAGEKLNGMLNTLSALTLEESK